MSEPNSNPPAPPHPRRRSHNQIVLPPISTIKHNGEPAISCPIVRGTRPLPTLRKGETFHVSNSPSSADRDPVLNFPALPRRCPTSTQALEDAITAGENRVANFLGNVERNLAGLTVAVPSTKPSLADADLPVPRGFLNRQIPSTDRNDMDSPSRDIQKSPRQASPKQAHRPTYADSGIGSSICGSVRKNKDAETELQPATQDTVVRLTGIRTTGITRSITINSLLSPEPEFSPGALKQIERNILVPILKEKNLKPFHPLVRGVPCRIEKREISCLRDLEKTLVFLAPAYAPTRNSYLGFCEFTIQCLHTTVGFLNERDQRRPTDRAYTNGYFLNLVEQIRQYAAMIGASRDATQSEPKEPRNKLDYSSDEELVLEGGLAGTGRPVELVRRKKDQAISLATGKPYEEPKPESPTLKRARSMETTDDSVVRSMARRKKDEPPLNINEKCKNCDKVFRRPCDLTKHEKTHSRPWKCPEQGCKYNKIGWPTEKEMTRHMNDKHSTAPPLYKCQFTPCTYQSKRESNCKQHMEKAHGWQYVRTKNNARCLPESNSASPQTPDMSTPHSGMMEIPTPVSAPAPSPYTPPSDTPPSHTKFVSNGAESLYRQDDFGISPLPDDMKLFPELTSPTMDCESSYFQPMDPNLYFASLQASDPNDYSLPIDMMAFTSTHSSTISVSEPGTYMAPSPSDPAVSPLDFDVNWDTLGNDYTVMNKHTTSPTLSNSLQGTKPGVDFLCLPLSDYNQKQPPYSPGGQGNIMLYSPSASDIDEGFYEDYDYGEKPDGDFTLYDTPSQDSFMAAVPNSMPNDVPMDNYSIGRSNVMLPPLSTLYDQFQNTEMPQQIDPRDLQLDEELNRMDEDF
ncbi:copper-binding transcription factor [Myotisia sp. PD_48]|nr:copper-binding transcription factor [Myotisia sp. PD_48]